jgi:hypothetical protein
MTGGRGCGGLRRVALAVEARLLPQVEGPARHRDERIPTSYRACLFFFLLCDSTMT